MKKALIIACLSLLYQGLRADDFTSKAKIDTVLRTGFYKVLLSPDAISVSLSDYADIRIFDGKHNEVPYILLSEKPATERSGFSEYKILENNYLPKQALTRVVVHNDTKNTISSLYLKVRSADVEKEITIKGSDDQKSWYIIKRNLLVNALQYNGETHKMMELEFPGSNYEYFELTLNDKKKDPIQIMSVGYYNVEVSKGLFTEIPVKSIRQADSAHKSYITLAFDKPYELSKLQLQVSGPAYYLRDCAIGNYHKTHHSTAFVEQGHFTLSSKSVAIWEFYKTKTNELTIIIDNSDNPPLKVTAIKAFQLNKYLIAHLEKGKSYDLCVGNKSLAAPEYDLKYFTDSIGGNIPILNTSQLKSIASMPTSKPNISRYKALLWLAVALVIAILGWFSIKIAREMNQRKSSE